MTFGEILYAVTGAFGWVVIGLAAIALAFARGLPADGPPHPALRGLARAMGRDPSQRADPKAAPLANGLMLRVIVRCTRSLQPKKGPPAP